MDKLIHKDPDTGKMTFSIRDMKQIFDTLHAYEELDMTPDDIEQTFLRFSSFLMEMTGGRMSKTNYTVQAMVAVANDYQQQELDEIEKELERVKAERDALKIDKLNLTSMVEQLEKVREERDAAIAAICKIAERGTTWMCPYCKNAKSIYGGCCDCTLEIGVCRHPFTKFEWRGEKLEDSYFG